MGESAHSRLRDIRQALLSNEMFLEYLPTIKLSDGTCAGSEALIRWRRDGQIVAPLEFIPFVENTPLAGLLTYWVIETVGRELGAWLKQQRASIHIGINIPPELLGRGGIEYAVLKSELADIAHKLVLEVSERGVIDQLGVQELNDRTDYKELIALDDVQLRELSSLLLARVKFDIIKLDKAVVEFLAKTSDNRLIDTVRALASMPGLSIIGEGVETDAESNRLKDLGIEYAQGFLFSRPLSAHAFTEYFESHSG